MASILDQFEQDTHNYSSKQSFDVNLSGGMLMEPWIPTDSEVPIFNKQRVNFRPPDPVTHFSVCNNFLIIAVSSGVILRIDQEHPEHIDEVEVTKAVSDQVYRLYQDPTGRHVIISMKSTDNYYLSRNSKKVRLLSKLRGHLIDSVGWNWQNANETSTGAILIGTSKGLILETDIAADESRMFSSMEQYFKQLFSVTKENVRPVTGLAFDRLSSTTLSDYRYYIIVTTPGRLYQFVGMVSASSPPPMFVSIFQEYETDKVQFLEIPESFGYSELQVYYPKFREPARWFAWMTGPGIYYGDVDSKTQTDTFLINTSLMYYDEDESKDTDKTTNPVSICVTEFHILVLFADRLKAFCLLNHSLVYETMFPSGNMLGLCKDPIRGFVFVYSPSSVFRYKITREARDVWKIYLEKGDFEKAKFHAQDNPSNFDRVLTEQADMLYKNEEYTKSALIYAGTRASFEEMTLKFITLDDINPLKTFLLKKLDCLKSQDKTQITMLVMWLVEIFLNRLGELKEQGQDKAKLYDEVQENFRRFIGMQKLRECVSNNRNTIYDLISSHGNIEEMVFFAKLMEDFERVIGHRIQHDDYLGVLDILKKQNEVKLFYKFSPLLMQYIPHETVDAWIGQGQQLQPRLLIPALVQYDHIKFKEQGNEAIRYLEFCIHRLDNRDQAIHNYLLSLYAQIQPQQLMRYLQLQGQDPELLCYDIKFALRLCAERNLKEACVHIYSVMGLYEEAVDLALSVDVELAKLQADKPDECDDELRKKLWLRIARHVVEEESDVKRAMAFLHECNLLKIEDILPFFPDFVTIDHFKDAIIQSLQEYNEHIDTLKEQMEEATVSAEEIRKEIHSFRNKYTYVNSQDKCSSCDYPLMTRSFYLFPCRHRFHSDCLVSEILPLLSTNVRLKVEDLGRQLSECEDGRHYSVNTATAVAPSVSKEQSIKSELDEIVSAECIYCGEFMIRNVDLPFVEPNDVKAVMASWL